MTVCADAGAMSPEPIAAVSAAAKQRDTIVESPYRIVCSALRPAILAVMTPDLFALRVRIGLAILRRTRTLA
jgi:hypothetical protein